MKKQDRSKVREKLEEELKEFRKLSRAHRGGRLWLREIRQALGVSVTELAHRLDCSRGLVYRIEEGERDGEDRIEVMEQLAKAMDCTLIYAIVPKNGQTLEETAEWLKKYPEWRTEKQEARRTKEMDAQNRRWHEAHWEWVQQQKEARAQAKRRAQEAVKMAEDWAAERAKEGAEQYGMDAGQKPPAEWWTAQDAESMRKQGIPGDWALRMALFASRARGETESRQGGGSGSRGSKSGPGTSPSR